METMRQVILQEMNEERFNRKHIDTKIRAAIDASPEMQAKLQQGVALVEEWLQGTYYASKMARLQQLEGMDIPSLVMDIFTGVAYCQRAELFTSVSSQMAARLKFSDRTEAITTVAELLAVLCETDAYDIGKENKQASLMLVSRIPLPEVLLDFIENSQYLPPMVCEPLKLSHNFSSGYLTHNDSLILGSGNHHDGDLCLDVLNIQNSVRLSMDLDFLCKVEEEPNEPITPESVQKAAAKRNRPLKDGEAVLEAAAQREQWLVFKRQSYVFYDLMAQQGNSFYLTHKVDKRGRNYSQGYHITTQGTPFKKAMLELADAELVTGVPAP